MTLSDIPRSGSRASAGRSAGVGASAAGTPFRDYVVRSPRSTAWIFRASSSVSASR